MRHGFEYSSNMMDRLRPYCTRRSRASAWSDPVSWVLDDAPFFMFTGQRAMRRRACCKPRLTELDGITESGGVTNFTFHPQIIGRPSRFACLKELVEHARRTPKLWLARLDQIAAHARTALA